MDDGFSWFIEANGGKVEAAAPSTTPKKPRQPKQPANGVVAVGWTLTTDTDHTAPTKGRAVIAGIMEREDVVFDGLKVKELVKTSRYFGYILVQTFIDRLLREKTIGSIWEVYADGTGKKVR